MILSAMFVALISVGAFIKIPIPVVPFTLQYLFTMLAGLLLGKRRGSLAVCVYVALGLMGLPVFAQGGGFGYIFQPSFGYIIGFAVGAYVTGAIAGRANRPGFGLLLCANFAGLGIVYLFGMVYYYLISNFYLNTPLGIWPLFLYCFLLAVPGDILLCIAGAVIGRRMIPLVRDGKL
ncbi:biotin transporter BioY [bacterium 1XD21-13]|nr:biotin transporter BioY [bacterium 1XD21-13]